MDRVNKCNQTQKVEAPNSDLLPHECLLPKNHEEEKHRCICWHTWKDEK